VAVSPGREPRIRGPERRRPPILKFLTFPFFIVTLGLFTFVLNAVMLWLTSVVSKSLGLGFDVDGFGAAFVGALLVTIVSFVLSLFVESNDGDTNNRS
jgi:putative membrane protein